MLPLLRRSSPSSECQLGLKGEGTRYPNGAPHWQLPQATPGSIALNFVRPGPVPAQGKAERPRLLRNRSVPPAPDRPDALVTPTRRGSTCVGGYPGRQDYLAFTPPRPLPLITAPARGNPSASPAAQAQHPRECAPRCPRAQPLQREPQGNSSSEVPCTLPCPRPDAPWYPTIRGSTFVGKYHGRETLHALPPPCSLG